MMNYYLALTSFAQALADDLYNDDESHRVNVRFAGKLEGNYPWIYVRFRVLGYLPASSMEYVQLRLQAFLDENGGGFDGIRIHASDHQGFDWGFTLRVTYREDWDYKKNGPRVSPGAVEKTPPV